MIFEYLSRYLTKKTSIYHLKALDSFLDSTQDTQIDIWLIKPSHKTTKEHQMPANQEFIRNLLKQSVGAIKTMCFTH